MNEIVNFVKEHDNWEELLAEKPYCLKIKRDEDYILFMYDQINSDFSLPLVQEARGIIFYEPTWECVCRPFRKFFNYGEPNAAEIDWSKAAVTEKIDGSLIKVWAHNGVSHISTNGTINAEKAEVNDAMSFFDLYIKTIGKRYLSIDLNNTYLFELVSPYNRVVIPYEKPELYSLGVINNRTGEWKPLGDERFLRPRYYRLDSLDSVIAAANALDWHDEGFVVFDGVNRIKVKSPAYVIAHYARNNNVMTNERLIEVVLRNEEEEFLTYADDYSDRIEDIKNRLKYFQNELVEMYSELVRCLDLERRDYAKKVKEYPNAYHFFAFKLYDGKVLSIFDLPANKVEKILFGG